MRQIVQLLDHQLHHVKAVEDNQRPGHVPRHRRRIDLAHIHRHRLDLSSTGFEPTPEPVQRLARSPAVAVLLVKTDVVKVTTPLLLTIALP